MGFARTRVLMESTTSATITVMKKAGRNWVFGDGNNGFDHKKAKWDEEVVNDGIYIPATDDEVMKYEDLIDHKSSLHSVLDNSQTVVCNSNDDTFVQEFMSIDCEGLSC
ncbi:hypothetical protein L1987_68785 [Smallanthus sonchifolius]|uniref:Uncharacterized protein n=1 Tax=Smallanthus sonchifolius TaxID=185202 RepID=A0ACB9B4C8_9ASTR|nr:hypothetical protein L1987_68785 [Smallanthus sonchifolius]